jgi:hypothetical protein
MARRNAKPANKKLRLLPDAFLEAVLDAGGDETLVLETLELRPRELHDWLGKNLDVIDAARLALEEREIDTSEPEFGWLRHSGQLDLTGQFSGEEDSNWSQYRGLLQQEVKLEARDKLQDSLGRTQALVAELQAKKRARLEQKQPRTAPEESD